MNDAEILIECEKAASQIMRYTRKKGKKKFVERFLRTLRKLFEDCKLSQPLHIRVFRGNKGGDYCIGTITFFIFLLKINVLSVFTPTNIFNKEFNEVLIDIFSHHRTALRKTYTDVFYKIIVDMKKLYRCLR